MGKFIEKYKLENPNFSFELNELIQKIKSENNQETEDLFSTINSLREKLDQSIFEKNNACLLYTSPSPRDGTSSRMPSSA